MASMTNRSLQSICAAACLVIAASVTLARSPQLRSHLWLTQNPTGYHIGETLEVSQDVFGASESTVVVFASSWCPACQASVGLFRSILREVRLSPSTRFALLLTGPKSPRDSLYVNGIGVAGNEVWEQSAWKAARVKLDSIPTILVVDRLGRVELVWVGAPGSEAESQSVANDVQETIRRIGNHAIRD